MKKSIAISVECETNTVLEWCILQIQNRISKAMNLVVFLADLGEDEKRG